MLNSILDSFKKNKPLPTDDYGFYLSPLNQNTFLYNSLKRNTMNHVVNYFQDLSEAKRYKKWLCPLYCDITLFNNYEATIAPLRKTIEKNNGYYFFDLSIESIPYDPLDSYLSQQFKSFHLMLDQNGIDPSRVYFANANLVADKYYDEWRNKLNIRYRIENKLLTHQYSLSGFSDPFTRYFSKDNLFQENINIVEDSIANNVKRNYYFTCLMLRPRTHRTAIMLHLLERNHLDKGIVSYYGNDFGNKDAITVETEEASYQNISQLPSGKRLVTVWEDLKKRSPVTIDATLNTIKQLGWAPKDLGFFPRDFIECASIKSRSYFEIVSETHFTDETCLYITEKTLWAIVSLQPFIIVGSPFTLRYLKELGFQTFSPFINESYDDEPNPTARLELIISEIDRLCSMSENEIHNLYSELWPRLLHNYHLYFSKSKEIAAQEIHKRILSPINHSLELTS